MRLILAIGITLVTILIMLGLFQLFNLTMPWWWSVPFINVLVGAMVFFASIYRYKRPKADQALVRTGGRRVFIAIGDGGYWGEPFEGKRLDSRKRQHCQSRPNSDRKFTQN